MNLPIYGTCLNDGITTVTDAQLQISGCTDALANNFNAEATDDDGSCLIHLVTVFYLKCGKVIQVQI